mmetsp:Transcript_17541/g.34237  ORF Transcript_17541/g.34237 Transcript_17541/m.34237 type:complete len:755 (+) Transcript_17541:30-2294(+)|eukprot:CAMPEP_0175145392 /NCGR_PEP_ID=MMETSP0087-20121206/14737_1 /TAXON_ID=136419 /ORGANISM="Unknown Unknown, Strain D1" /LENGTH=754 /DNA_ID=CAMNT_0016430117 /DNA_START=33 /DNA_END=2297 /DNA_ORIENTATION=-
MGAKESVPGRVSSDEGVAKYSKHFAKGELGLLDSMFRELASRSPGATMDKATFLKLFNLPGMIGERLFAVFDTKKNGVIDYEEFIEGIVTYGRGSTEDKLKMLFNMYDLTGDNAVSPVELSTMLHSLVGSYKLLNQEEASDISQASPSELQRNSLESQQGLAAPRSPIREGYLPEDESQRGSEIKVEEPVNTFMGKNTTDTVDAIVKHAFEQCDLSRDGKLHFNEFVKFTEAHPEVMQALEKVFVLRYWNEPKQGARALRRRASSAIDEAVTRVQCTCGWVPAHCYRCGRQYETEPSLTQWECEVCGKLGKDGGGLTFCMVCGSAMLEKRITVTAEAQEDESFAPAPDNDSYNEGRLYKKGHIMKKYLERWYVCRGNFLYSFKKISDKQPGEVTFLEGCFVQLHDKEGDTSDMGEVATTPRKSASSNAYYGFELLNSANQTIKVLFAKTKEERAQWVNILRKGSKSFPIQDFYKIGKQIGKGKFSHVHEGTHLRTGTRYAIKVINKGKVASDDLQKEALRAEIAILKLVSHKNIISMKEIFESPDQMFIVMQYVAGGDLFDRIIKRKRFREEVAKQIIFNLLNGVKYLHDRGVVHRDLKPENILCGDEEDDSQVLITDFGLSKFARPAEVMSMPCGTLAYVAPEVLLLQGYGSSVDLWSIGVITYLLIRGGLPFDGATKGEIIERTLHGKVSFRHVCWETVSPNTTKFIEALLTKNSAKRLNVDQAIAHPWFSDLRQQASETRRQSEQSDAKYE